LVKVSIGLCVLYLYYSRPVRLLSESASHSVVFFSHNKSASTIQQCFYSQPNRVSKKVYGILYEKKQFPKPFLSVLKILLQCSANEGVLELQVPMPCQVGSLTI
jgi:hypothetical protein